ncbi:Hypothetical predicted protein [Mytilus galloprovincialis]|uniref:Fibronectin type-III domain-containing protein n=1 Tax=Mytilus galloprovincialis TaxID=29158 RepID=A0A8B6CJX5_MYTGA|nr:Hypothetical predicted protein [Mytilus galloprovincialis]
MDSSRIKSIRAGNRAAVTKFFKKLDELNTDSEMDIDIAGPIIDAIVKKQSRKLSQKPWQLLVNTLGKTHKIVNAYMKALLNLPAPSYTLDSIRNFSDKSEVCYPWIRIFRTVCQDTYGSLLIPVMLGKLPITVKSNITRENGNDDWTLGNLRKAIQREISIQEASTNGSESYDIPTASFHAGIEQEKRGFIEKVEEKEDEPQRIHYIPHHPVKKDSTTTPIRIVYDCSCKKNTKSPSLNDCLHSYPPISNDITELLTRFRTQKFAVTTDIEKAFLQVGLHKSDRDEALTSDHGTLILTDYENLLTQKNVLDSSKQVNILGMSGTDDKLLFAEVDIDSTMIDHIFIYPVTAPRRFDIVECTDCSITIEWFIDVQDECLSYELDHRPPQGKDNLSGRTFSSKDVVEGENGRRMYTLQNLLPETCYEFKLRSVYKDAKSHYSKYKTKQTLKLGR